jgi:hypothetical protein
MWPSGAAHAARTGLACAGGSFAAARVCRGKDGELLRQPGRTAVRTFGPLPITRPYQDLAVALTFFAMKFVYRHELKIAAVKKKKPQVLTTLDVAHRNAALCLKFRVILRHDLVEAAS